MLAACEGMDAVTEGTYRARDQNDPTFQRFLSSAGVSSEQAIKHMEDVQRRCQVFDAATLARRGELLKGAYEGGAEGSALPYLVWINAGQQAINPELRGKLQRDARQTAEDGDRLALAQFSFPFSTAHLGITEVQRQAYREAGLRITGEASGAEEEKSSRVSSDNSEKMMAQWGRVPPPLSPQQQREADALAAKVVDAWRKRQAKGGWGPGGRRPSPRPMTSTRWPFLTCRVTGPGRLHRLFEGELPDKPKARKTAKPDLEALARLPAFHGCPHGALLFVKAYRAASNRRALSTSVKAGDGCRRLG